MANPEPFSIYHLLKDFHPSLAAAIALSAAYLAYTGAMAKVRHDQDAAAREYSRKKLALFLRLRFEVRVLALLNETMHDKAAGIFKEIRSYEGDVDAKAEFLNSRNYEPFRLTPALDEAWLHLHYFPLSTAQSIDRLRRRLFLLRHRMETLLRNVSVEDLEKSFNDISTFATDVREGLDGLIAATLSDADLAP